MDSHTGFLFVTPTWQAYDPMGGTLTSPDWRLAPNWRFQRMQRQPQLLDLHNWRLGWHRDPLSVLQEATSSPDWWLQRVDPNINRMFPRLEPETGKIRSPGKTEKSILSQWPTDCGFGPFLTNPRLQKAVEINDQLEHLGIVQGAKMGANGFPWTSSTNKMANCPPPSMRVSIVPPMFGSDVRFCLKAFNT